MTVFFRFLRGWAHVTDQGHYLHFFSSALLLATIGLSNSGISLLAPNQANLIKAINVLEPTTNLLFKYNPEYTCLLMGAKTILDTGGYQSAGGNGRTHVLDTSLALGDDPYHYPVIRVLVSSLIFPSPRSN